MSDQPNYSEMQEWVDQLRAALEQERAARRVASDAANRFRDIVAEALDLNQNPGDDELVRLLRQRHGKGGPEPRRWRDFITGTQAHLENNGLRWAADAAMEGPDARP